MIENYFKYFTFRDCKKKNVTTVDDTSKKKGYILENNCS